MSDTREPGDDPTGTGDVEPDTESTDAEDTTATEPDAPKPTKGRPDAHTDPFHSTN